MIEIEAINGIKRFASQGQWCLVYKGAKVQLLARPGAVTTTGEDRTMLAGAKEELLAEVDRLGLEYRGPR